MKFGMFSQVLTWNLKVFSLAVLTTFATTATLNQPTYAESPTFYWNKSNGLPTTFVRTQDGKNLPVIHWISNYFTGLTAQQGCLLVSRRFQRNYDNGTLRYIKAEKPKTNDFFNTGWDKYEKRDFEGAIADFNQALQVNPNYAGAYYGRGVARSALRDFEAAITDYNQALRINPNFAEAYNNRALNRAILRDNQGAIADYNQALRINPNFSFAYFGRGKIRLKLGDKQAAITDFNQALRVNPNYAKAYYLRGITRATLGDYQKAIVDVQKAAQIYQQQGNTEWYQRALELSRGLERGAQIGDIIDENEL